MAKRKRLDEFELPAALGAAVAAYYGPRKFARLEPEKRAEIANELQHTARMLQAIVNEEPRPEPRVVA